MQNTFACFVHPRYFCLETRHRTIYFATPVDPQLGHCWKISRIVSQIVCIDVKCFGSILSDQPNANDFPRERKTRLFMFRQRFSRTRVSTSSLRTMFSIEKMFETLENNFPCSVVVVNSFRNETGCSAGESAVGTSETDSTRIKFSKPG